MQRLDLKFVCHHGEFIKHRMASCEELAGRDNILVHRLLKNTVNEHLGGHAYALYSDRCVQAMGIDPIVRRASEDQTVAGVRGPAFVLAAVKRRRLATDGCASRGAARWRYRSHHVDVQGDQSG